MTYVEGFVLAVPTAGRAAYERHAAAFQPLFAGIGIRRVVETWSDDVPDGTLTDFRKAVQATDDESIVFSWFEYPDRAARDAAVARMTTDPEMQALSAGEMPFDRTRMIVAGFDSIVDEGSGAGGGYVDGFLAPVLSENKEAYRAMARRNAGMFQEYGALRMVEGWGDDVPDGKITDFRRAVHARDGETVVFAWIEWPDRASRDAGWARVMADERMTRAGPMPFDGKRMVYGGFVALGAQE